MNDSLKLSRREVLKGAAGVTLVLPILEAMGAEVSNQAPRRCYLYGERDVSSEGE